MKAPLPGSRQKAARVIERQVVYLRRLVDDLLDAERARRGDLKLETRGLDLRSVVTDAVETFRPRAQERGVNLSKVIPFEPVVMNGDAVRLQQVVANVLDNAVKHTSSGGRIRVRLAMGAGQAVLSVREATRARFSLSLSRTCERAMVSSKSFIRLLNAYRRRFGLRAHAFSSALVPCSSLA